MEMKQKDVYFLKMSCIFLKREYKHLPTDGQEYFRY